MLRRLEERILSNPNYPYEVVDQKHLGMFLCGENAKFAEEPFELAFLENVSHNNNSSMPAILWLQLNKLYHQL